MTISSAILFLGDVYLDRPYQIPAIDPPLVFNLEAPLTEHDKPVPDKIVLKSSGDFLKKTFDPLPMAVCLANNHIMDYGVKGFQDTIKFLESNQIGYFGAGTPKNNHNNPLVLDIAGHRTALLGYCYNAYFNQVGPSLKMEHTPAPLDADCIKRDITAIRGKCDRIIVNLHWGKLYSNYPRRDEIELARKLIDAGANVLIGHHAHTLQPVETYKNGLIAYNIGNFIFPDIDLPTHYTDTGQPTRRRIIKQRKWHNSGAGILVDIPNITWEIKCFLRCGDAVKYGRSFFHQYLDININNIYKKADMLSLKSSDYKKVFEHILNYLDNPKIPSKEGSRQMARQLKALWPWEKK